MAMHVFRKSTLHILHDDIIFKKGFDVGIIMQLTVDNTKYAHRLYHKYGTIAELPPGKTSYNWVITASDLSSFFEESPCQKTIQFEVLLDTYSDSSMATKIGQDSCLLDATLTEELAKPTITNYKITDNNEAARNMDMIVNGKSNLSATQDIETMYGAAVSEISYTCNTLEYSDVNDLIAALPLTYYGKVYSIACKVKDSRGFTNTVVLEKTCTKYRGPDISLFNIIRCDSEGTQSDNGTKAKILVKGSFQSFNMHNDFAGVVKYKTEKDTDYTEGWTFDIPGNNIDDIEEFSYEHILDADFDAETEYMFTALFKDMFETFTTEGTLFSNSKDILHVSSDGNEIIFGSRRNRNVLIGPDSVKIRNGENSRASFEDDKVTLGDGYLEMACGTADDGTKATSIGSMDDAVTLLNLLLANSSVQIEGGSKSGVQLIGDNINLAARKALTCNIPVRSNADANNFYESSGCVYLHEGSTNRPTTTNGWLFYMTYYDLDIHYCHQIYITANGDRYHRTMKKDVWGAWHHDSAFGLTESRIGTYEGKPVYRKVIKTVMTSWATTTNFAAINVAHGIKNFGVALNVSSYVARSDRRYKIPYYNENGVLNTFFMYADNTNVVYRNKTAWGSAYTLYTIIDYTKTTDY
jgi:hypothetical protein